MNDEPVYQTRRSPRLWVFLLVLILGLAAGLGYVFSRDSIYETGATLLTVKPQGVDQPSADADIQHVAIQRRLLLSDDILQRIVERLQASGFSAIQWSHQLRPVLNVIAVENTNLVELRARGKDPALLQAAVNSWADVYSQRRAELVMQASGRTTLELKAELEEIENLIAIKQQGLSEFRDKHDIVSLERGQNKPASRLAGLNKSLNSARERLLKASSKVEVMQAAEQAGRFVISEGNRARLSKLRKEAATLRQRIAELSTRYTQVYMDRDPRFKHLPGRLKNLQNKITSIRNDGRKQAKDEAAQELAESEQAVAQLEEQLTLSSEKASEFSQQFQALTTLQGELDRLETVRADLLDRLAKIEVKNLLGFPPLQLVDLAPLPSSPVWPQVERDALIVIGVVVVLALFVAWLLDYLTRHNQESQPHTDIRIISADAVLPKPNEQEVLLTAGESRMALIDQSGNFPRTLTLEELQDLMAAANPEVARRLALLLSGVAPDELVDLAGCAEDVERGILSIPGKHARDLCLGSGASRYLFGAGNPAWGEDDLEDSLPVVAADAGLTQVTEITPEAIRHTYLLYLVQQGARLQELGSLFGHIPDLSNYASYSPEGPGRPLSEIELEHPVFIRT